MNETVRVSKPTLLRSLLYVPAHVERLRVKALTLRPDATLLDLEDAVPPDQKDNARAGAREYISSRPGHAFVRINPFRSRTPFTLACGHEDVEAIVVPGLRGIRLPKTESVEDVLEAHEALLAAERKAGIDPGRTELQANLESASGVSNVDRLANTHINRPFRLCFGAGDYTLDIGVEWTRDEGECLTARSLVVIGSRAAGLPKPLDSVFPNIADIQGFRASATRAKQFGFGGKAIIHPTQIEALHAIFTPTEEEASWAQKVVDAFEDAQQRGLGAIAVEGRLIDYPIVERATHVLALWEAARAVASGNTSP